MLIADVYDEIYRRTATRARVNKMPDIGATVDDVYALQPIVQRAAIEVARDTGRLEAAVVIDLVADQYAYKLTRGVTGIKLIEMGGRSLKHVNGPRARGGAEEAESGSPVCFGIFADEIIISPAPSADYIATDGQGTMTAYYLMASAISSNADWPSGSTGEESPAADLVAWLPVELESALINLCLAAWYRDLGMFDDMHIFQEEYGIEIKRQRTSYDPRKASTSKTVPRYF